MRPRLATMRKGGKLFRAAAAAAGPEPKNK
jgi:hypothetical protein